MPALYRKYRSESFAEVIGQPQVTEVLEASLKKGRTTHCYLFIGPHGVGKTSVARILAFALINEPYATEKKHIDIIEIDAASNTGVDNIRDLIDKSQIAPSLAEKKIYIIDEVHMLSKSAFNALLKLLEEPPKHVVFILATTEENKVPSTIASRMQKFVFRKIPINLVTEQLKKVAKKEKIKVGAETITAIAEFSNGSMRDAISLFDQMSSLANEDGLNEAAERSILGLASKEVLNDILISYQTGEFGLISQKLAELKKQNLSASDIASQLAYRAQDLLGESPDLVSLMPKLIDVQKSSLPDISLSVALFPENSIVPNAATKKRPTSQRAKTKPTEQSVAEDPTGTEPKPTTTSSEFDWDKLVELITGNAASKPISGYIRSASYKLEGDKLTIKLKNSFEQKTLSAPGRFNSIQQALSQLGRDDLVVNLVVNETVRKANKKTSDIIQFMGGGEEINLNGKI